MWKWLLMRWFAPLVLMFATMPGVCPPPLRSRPYVSGPQIFFLHFAFQTIGGAQFDQRFNLPFPCNSFFLVSINKTANSLFLHLTPTNRSNPTGSATVTVLGNEEWFPMTALQLASTNYWAAIRFKDPIQIMYLSGGSETGTSTILTLACVADDTLIVNGGMWT
jgi:hypothetical protein